MIHFKNLSIEMILQDFDFGYLIIKSISILIIIIILNPIKISIVLVYSVYLSLIKHGEIKPGPFSMCTSRIHPCLLGAVIMSS